MRILGIRVGEFAAAALVDGSELTAVARRNVARRQPPDVRGRVPQLPEPFPWDVTGDVLEQAGLELADVDRVVFGSHLAPLERIAPQVVRLGRSLLPQGAARQLLGRTSRMVREMTVTETGLWTVAASVRIGRLTQLLADRGFAGDVKTLDHYRSRSHAAWRCQSGERRLVITASPSGDGTTLTVSAGNHDGLRLLYRQGELSALHAHTEALAQRLGVRAVRLDTALAQHLGRADAPPRLVDELERDLHFVDGGFNVTRPGGAARLQGTLARYAADEVAAAGWRNLRRQLFRLLRYWVGRTGIRQLVFAGELLDEPRLCPTLLAHPDIDTLFVPPATHAESLAMGAAMRYADVGPARMPTPRLGPALGEADCEAALRRSGLEVRTPRAVHREIARSLAAGEVVARVTGRPSIGTRSLGERSLLLRADGVEQAARVARSLERSVDEPWVVVMRPRDARRWLPDHGRAREAARVGTVALRLSRTAARRCPVAHGERVLPRVVGEGDDAGLHRVLGHLDAAGETPMLVAADLRDGDGRWPRTADEVVRQFLDSPADRLVLGRALVARPPRR